MGCQLLLEAPQVLLVPSLDQFADQSGSGDEANAMTALTSGQTQRQGDVRLTCAAVAEQQDVLLACQVLRARQFEDQGLVECGDGEEVETVEALYDGELRLSDAALGGAAITIEQLQFGQPQQILREGGLFLGAGASQLVVLAQHGGQ